MPLWEPGAIRTQYVRASLGENAMSVTAPWPLFQDMDRNVAGGFLERETWHALRKHTS